MGWCEEDCINLEATYMFDLRLTCLYHCMLTSSYRQISVPLLLSSHPLILISLWSCVLVSIFASLHHHILRFICSCLHLCMLVSVGSCVLACILASSYSHFLRFISVSLYPHILLSSYPHVHVWLFIFLHPHILISSGSCVLVGIFASSHPYILSLNNETCRHSVLRMQFFVSKSYVCLLVCSHRQFNVFSI